MSMNLGGGRPRSTSELDEQMVYYFYRCTDDISKPHYSSKACAELLNISLRNFYSKAREIDKKCAKDDNYKQSIMKLCRGIYGLERELGVDGKMQLQPIFQPPKQPNQPQKQIYTKTEIWKVLGGIKTQLYDMTEKLSSMSTLVSSIGNMLEGDLDKQDLQDKFDTLKFVQ